MSRKALTSTQTKSSKTWQLVFLAAALSIPGLILRLSGAHIDPPIAALLFGIGIVGAAFLLSWAAEAAQVDVSASFAIAVLAIITILPEYAVEAVLAWDAGSAFATDPTAPEIGRVAANVTGANRLLIGLGWPAVVLAFWLRRRRILEVRGGLPLEISILLVATLLSILFSAMGFVPLWLSAILIGMYLFYLWMSSRHEAGEPELEGPAATIGALSKKGRRATVVLLFIFSAAVILLVAEPFVESLIETGEQLGIDEFLLIQWLAPLASEAPEMLVAVLFALRANPVAGITALISAEVNQMTVLVGSMPVIFSAALGEAHSFPLDSRQMAEFLFTASLALFAIATFARMRLTHWHALILLAIFVGQLAAPQIGFINDLAPEGEGGFHLSASFVLFGLALLVLVWDFGRAKALVGMFRAVVPRGAPPSPEAIS